MDVFNAYTYGTAAWLAIQATPLLIVPKVIISMLTTDVRPMTELESYLSRSLALALLTLAVINLVLTGTIPLTNTTSGPDTDEKPAYAYPVVIIVTTYHALTSFYIYTQYSWTGSISFLLGLIGSVGLFCMGTWVILFGSEQGKVSKTTGADKRTSNFPFKNEESAREKKKASRKRL